MELDDGASGNISLNFFQPSVIDKIYNFKCFLIKNLTYCLLEVNGRLINFAYNLDKRLEGKLNLQIINVNKWYNDVQALKDINVDIQTNEFTTLLGPSGCGKTTLLKIIAGLETPDTGEIYFNDRCIFSKEKNINISPQKRELGMVFQEFALWPHMTIYNNVAFPLKARNMKKNIKESVAKVLKMVKLENMEKRYPSQLSGGQQQRVAFARAVVSNPEIVLFDEPLSALDAVLRDEMRTELCSMVKEMNLTAIYVTHDQVEAMAMSDAIIVMNKGKIMQVGSPETIYQTPKNRDVIKFIGKTNWQNNKAIRPEQVSLNPIDNARLITGTVKQVAYMGDKYEVMFDINSGEEWTVYSQNRLCVGDHHDLYINDKQFAAFE